MRFRISSRFRLRKQKTSKSAEDATTSTGAVIKIGEHTYPLLAARSMWSTTEQMDLITSYKTWDDGTKLSQSKKLIPISKLWLSHIPDLMGKKFGRVRATPNNLLASSPYQSKWIAIRRKVSDYKTAQIDGREDELPDIEGPTGGGVDENGLDDPRMIAASAVAAVRDSKRNLRYIDGVDEESMKIIKYFMDTFPQSVSGVGLMSESDLTSGAGSKREFCQMEGFQESDVQENSTEGGDGAAKKVSKASLIIDLTRTAVQHHEENMTFNKSNFENQKESRLQDIQRREEKDVREVEYREKKDVIEQQRYHAEQTRLAEARQDNINVQITFSNILSSLLKKI